MDVAVVALAIIQLVTTVVLIIFTTLHFSKRLKPFEKIGDVLDNVVGDDEAVANVTEAANSLIQIGQAAEHANEILQDEELLDGFLQEIAKRGVKIFQMSLLGTKSGDSRKMAKAERLVEEGMVDAIAKINPVIGIFLEASGLGEELRENPNMLGYVVQAVQNKGLLNMFDLSSLGVPATGKQAQTKPIGRDFIG